MPTYNYRAINETGRSVKGELAADNDIDLDNRLQQLGLDLVDYREANQKKSSRFSRIKLQDMIVLCLHLEQLSRAGVPLLDSIADVRDSTESEKLRDVMAGVYESVKAGEQMSQALASYPGTFNEVFIGLVAAGEKTGDMSESYNHLAEHMKWSNDLRRKFRKAIGYPIALLVVMSIVITVLMVFVVPKLVDFIQSQGFDIPIHTRALIVTSDVFVNYWYLVFGIPIVTLIGLFIAYRTSESFEYKVDGIMLNVPVIGGVLRKINMARFTHFFAVMFRSGIDILDALGGAAKVVGNKVLQEATQNVRQSVAGGTSLTESLRISNQFPNLVVRMFKVGEESGNMNDALENINFFYNREVNDAVDAMVGMIQPALTIVMGTLIFWVISAVFGPLYDSFSKMNF